MGEQLADDDDEIESWLRDAARVSRAAPAPLQPGTELLDGRFLIRSKLGEGGMGVVYEAIDRERGQRVALKTLPLVSAAAIYRLKQEFRALAGVVHPHLVRLYEFFNEDERWYFTMELIDAVPVDRWLRPAGRLDVERLRDGLAQLASAVSAIHGARKLHRDLKPSNAVVDPEGRVVVLDFGLAADPELGGVGQTVAGDAVSGTPAYMAPEQAAGREASEASDWYSVGVMLFEALTGELPFEGRGGEIMAAKQVSDGPAPSSRAAGVPEDLDRLCAALLRLDPAARAGAAEIRAVVGEPVGGAASARPSRPAPDPRARLLGRETELAQLRDAYAAAKRGEKPVVVLVAGESGIGKTSLVERFLVELRDSEPAVLLAGRCYERESVPFKAFDTVVDELSRHLRRLGRDADVLMPRDLWALRQLFPVLGRIDAVAAAAEREAADIQDMRTRGFAALGELLVRMRDRAPLVLAIDDLQWSDADSTRLLMHLLRQADAPKLLCLITHRSEGAADNPHLEPLYAHLPDDIRIDCRTLALGALPGEAAQALAGAGGEALVREAGGNPFLLTELARIAGGSGAIARGTSLFDAVRTRVAALPDDQRRLLEVLAVCGRRTQLEIAGRAAGLTESAHASFDALRSGSLARTTSTPGLVACYHDKIREAVSEGLGEAGRVAIHRAMAEALLATPDPDPEHLAVHYERAGEPGKAAPHAALAARRAEAALAFRRAAELYQLALAGGVFDGEDARQLRVGKARALEHAGLGALAGDAYLEAMQGADAEEANRLKQRAARLYLSAGHVERGRSLLLDALDELGLDPPRTTAGVLAGYAYHQARLRLSGLKVRDRGPAPPEVDRRLTALQDATDALVRSEQVFAFYFSARSVREALAAGDLSHICQSLSWEVMSGAMMCGAPMGPLTPKVESVREVSDLGIQLAEQTGNMRALDIQLFARAHLEFLAGLDNEAGLRYFDRQLDLHREHSLPHASFNLAWTRCQRSQIRSLMMGHFAEVAVELPALLDEGWARNDLCIVPFLAGQLMPCRIAVEDLAAAARDLERAMEAWSSPSFTIQDNALYTAEMYLAGYEGDLERVLRIHGRASERLQGSSLRRLPYVGAGLGMVAVQALVRLALGTPDLGQRDRYLRRATALKGPSRGHSPPYDTLPGIMGCSIAAARGDLERALRLARGTLLAGETVSMVREPVRRALGEWIGGDEGKAMIDQARSTLRAGGVVDPDRFCNTFCAFRP